MSTYKVVKMRNKGARPKAQEAVLETAPKSGPMAGTPLTSEATTQSAAEQQRLLLVLKTGLEQKLAAFDNEVTRDDLYNSRIGGDLKIFRNLVTQQLNKAPLTMANLNEAEAMTKELRIKADFIRKRDKQNGKRREKLTEYADAVTTKVLPDLQIKAGTADGLLNDKSLKAGEHFKDFAKSLRTYEADPSDKPKAALVSEIDRYLKHFDKFSKSDQAKDENKRKREEVLKVQSQLAKLDAVKDLCNPELANKKDWTREEESKGTGQYLNMMLMLAEAPPKNLKEGKKELVLKVKSVKDAPKLVVKPASSEIAVEGFTAGGGASREMMASVMADKLQEMLGLELNAAVTKVVTVDGEKIGMKPGTKVTASAQAWVKDSRPFGEQYEDRFEAAAKKKGIPKDQLPTEDKRACVQEALASIPKEEVQNKAVFDLIAMHCDRHQDNFMMGDDNKLVPIDHGNILPTKDGLIRRGQKMGAPHAVLAITPAAKEKLSPELVERIQRLNADELLKTMKEAQAEMRKSNPDADKGDLDEGLDNARRSIEFMKHAAGELTLEQIYCAYSRNAADIFFTDEKGKLKGFARAVEFAKSYEQAGDTLVKQLSKVKGGPNDGQPDYEENLPKFKELGWFKTMQPYQFTDWAKSNPQLYLKILKDKIQFQPPGADLKPPEPVPPFPENYQKESQSKVKKPSSPTGDPPDPVKVQEYEQKLKDYQAKLEEAKKQGEANWKRYLALGGDATWARASQEGTGQQGLEYRIKVLENLAGMENVPLA